jgi:NTP pyrophosphatase (non-canonical NTP hydrolase)
MDELKNKIALFAKERDWEQFHSPKNLAMGLNIEASELLEIFLWLSDIESTKLSEEKKQHLSEEIGDVMIYLTNLASKFNLDPIECAKNKIILNELKYPAKKVKGNSKKYSEY